jgi:hypothetical protein
VRADEITVDGPISVLGSGDQNSYSQVSLTNINGSFIMKLFNLTNGVFSTQIAPSGCN